MSDYPTDRDFDDAEKIVLEFLRNSNDPVERDVADLVLQNGGDNRDCDDFLKEAMAVIEYYALVSERKDNIIIFDSNKDLEKCCDAALRAAAYDFAYKDKSLSDKLSDGEYRDAREMSEKLDKIHSALRDLKDRDRGRSGRRDDRGGRRDDRRDDRSSRRDSDRGRDRDRDRGRDGRRERSSRRDSDSSTTQHRKSSSECDSRRDQERREERSSSSKVKDDETVITIPKVTPIRLATVKGVPVPGETNRAYAPNRHGTYIISNEDGAFYTVLEHEGGTMENYEEHELDRSLISRDNSGGRVLRIADFRKIKVDSPEKMAAAGTDVELVYGENLSCISTQTKVPLYALSEMLTSGSSYQIARLDKYIPYVVSKQPLEAINTQSFNIKTNESRSFNKMRAWIGTGQALLPDFQLNDRFAIGEMLESLASHLTVQCNNILSLVSSVNGIDNFIEDWTDVNSWLHKPDNASVLERFEDVEGEFLQANFSFLTDEQIAAGEENGVLETTFEVAEDQTIVWVRQQNFVVLADGEISQSVQIANPDKPARVEYDDLPTFYSTCEKLIAHRNSKLSLATIVMVDTSGAQYAIIAGKGSTPVIRLRKLK